MYTLLIYLFHSCGDCGYVFVSSVEKYGCTNEEVVLKY